MELQAITSTFTSRKKDEGNKSLFKRSDSANAEWSALNSALSLWDAMRIRHTSSHKQEPCRWRYGSIARLSPLLTHSIRSDCKHHLILAERVKGSREKQKRGPLVPGQKTWLVPEPPARVHESEGNCDTGGPLLGSLGLLIFQKMPCYQGKHSCSKINKVKDAVRLPYMLCLSCGPSW